MTVAIALPVLSNGDAIGHDVLGMAAALRGIGTRVRLYAEKSLIDDDVLPLDSLMNAGASPDDVLIYHHSHGCEAGMRILRNWPGRVVVKYHNVTPPRFFTKGDVRDAAEAGLLQATELAKAFTVWVDSVYNGRELDCVCEELPPFMPTESLREAQPDANYASRLDDWTTTLLCVGRVAPNKNLLLAIDSLASYRERFGDARLIIAGGHVFPDYSEAVELRIRERAVEAHVAITGRVTSEQLKALYQAADVLLVTSEHEGFCVPLVEAMALNVPAVAVTNAAIPETAGPFAKYAEANADSLADAVHELIACSVTREKHLRAGQLRYRAKFRPDAVRDRFLSLMRH